MLNAYYASIMLNAYYASIMLNAVSNTSCGPGFFKPQSFAISAAQPTILTHPVDATVCLNSIAEFNCSTDGEYVVWMLNGTKKARGFTELEQEKFLHHSGVGKTLFVPGVRKFENTNITCTGGIPDGGTTTSNPVQLFVQG